MMMLAPVRKTDRQSMIHTAQWLFDAACECYRIYGELVTVLFIEKEGMLTVRPFAGRSEEAARILQNAVTSNGSRVVGMATEAWSVELDANDNLDRWKSKYGSASNSPNRKEVLSLSLSSSSVDINIVAKIEKNVDGSFSGFEGEPDLYVSGEGSKRCEGRFSGFFRHLN